MLHTVCGYISLRKGAAKCAGALHHVGASEDDGASPESGNRGLVTILKTPKLLILALFLSNKFYMFLCYSG